MNMSNNTQLQVHGVRYQAEETAERRTDPTPSTSNDPSTAGPTPAKKRHISSTEPKRSLDVMISRMVVLSGIPFTAFTDSEDLKHVFIEAGYELPTNENSIKDICLKFYEKTKNELVSEIQELKSEGHKFSLCLDLFNSGNVKYININLYCPFFKGNKTRNLGMCKILNSVDSENYKNHIETKLKEFDIKIGGNSDIISITSDESPGLIKLGQQLNCIHQFCLAQVLHSVILETFYTKTQMIQARNVEQTVTEDDPDGLQLGQTLSNETHKLKGPLKKVRQVVKIFTKAPGSEILIKHMKNKCGKKYMLQLDSDKCLNTLHHMIGTFIEVKAAISCALYEITQPIHFTKQEWSTLEDVYQNLDILKVTLEVVCRENATLVSADAATYFALKKLQLRNTPISRELYNNLAKRLKKNRLPIASLMQYLHAPKIHFDDYDADIYPRFANLRLNMMVDILSKHDSTVNETLKITETVSGNNHGQASNRKLTINTEIPNKESIDQYVNNIIDARMAFYSGQRQSIHLELEGEMLLFENCRHRGKWLSKVYGWLCTIKPTNRDYESAFSTKILKNKIETSPAIGNLDRLSFLRAYFQQQDNINK